MREGKLHLDCALIAPSNHGSTPCGLYSIGKIICRDLESPRLYQPAAARAGWKLRLPTSARARKAKVRAPWSSGHESPVHGAKLKCRRQASQARRWPRPARPMTASARRADDGVRPARPMTVSAPGAPMTASTQGADDGVHLAQSGGGGGDRKPSTKRSYISTG